MLTPSAISSPRRSPPSDPATPAVACRLYPCPPVLAFLGRYLGLLRQADFRRLWLSMSVSTMGSEVTFLALPLVAILVLHATPIEVAVLGAMPFVAFAIFGLPAGVWVDRVARKRV